MAKIRNPLFSMVVSGAFGDIIFDRRGYVRRKGGYRDRKSASQGNARQALTAAQRCAQVCGPETRKRLRAVADKASYWSAYLTKHILGSKRATFEERRAIYNGGDAPEPTPLEDVTTQLDLQESLLPESPAEPAPDWEAEALELGLVEVHLDYADEPPISPGLQLFMLAATLYDLGIYTELGDPATADAAAWRKAVEA
jgi:hypothetical protein